MDMLPYIVFSAMSAVWGGVVAFALNRWSSGWSLPRRVVISVMASLVPIFGFAGFALASSFGRVLLSMSPDEFLVPFAIQIVLILALSAPVAWLVSKYGQDKRCAPADVFE